MAYVQNTSFHAPNCNYNVRDRELHFGSRAEAFRALIFHMIIIFKSSNDNLRIITHILQIGGRLWDARLSPPTAIIKACSCTLTHSLQSTLTAPYSTHSLPPLLKYGWYGKKQPKNLLRINPASICIYWGS